jgi:hypothetical protein
LAVIRGTMVEVPSHRVVPSVLLALGLAAWCGFASGFHQSSTGAFVTWSISLAAVVATNQVLGAGHHHRRLGLSLPAAEAPWPRPGQGGRGRVLAGISPWLILGVVALAWELLGIDTKPDEPHLTISALAQQYRLLNAVLLLVWILAGLGYGAARARMPVKTLTTVTSAGANKSAAFGVLAMGVLGRQIPMPALLLPASRPVGVAFWLVAVGAAFLIDFTARRSDGRLANGGELIRMISGPAMARVVIGAAWAFAGWHLFAH